jgi:hypothetical protein
MSLNGMRMGGDYKNPLSKKDKISLTIGCLGSISIVGTIGYILWRLL